jgi:hypothetical protein
MNVHKSVEVHFYQFVVQCKHLQQHKFGDKNGMCAHCTTCHPPINIVDTKKNLTANTKENTQMANENAHHVDSRDKLMYFYLQTIMDTIH